MIQIHQFAPGTIISEAKTAGASSVRVSLNWNRARGRTD